VTYAGFAEHKISALRCYRTHGVRVIAGTDAGISPISPFADFARHLEVHVDAGIPPAEVIDIATSEAATALGVRTGTIAHGYNADLLVVHGNPLEDLAALRDIAVVVASGRVHVPSPGQPHDSIVSGGEGALASRPTGSG
jgi:imidazolonepropionase-like amidohydrolase